jgi:hypothetical protein
MTRCSVGQDVVWVIRLVVEVCEHDNSNKDRKSRSEAKIFRKSESLGFHK